MNKEPLYQFETSPKQKGTCPDCRKSKVFRFYEFITTGERLPEQYGKCEKINTCSYHKYPSLGELKGLDIPTQPKRENKPLEVIKFIDKKIFLSTLKHYENNNFTCWLMNNFPDRAEKAINKYTIGTAKDGSTIFWNLDQKGNVKTGKVIKYLNNGKRDRNTFPSWVHSKMKLPGTYKPCLFGANLIKEYPLNTTICLIEAEKGAIIGSILYPEYLWLATGGAKSLTIEKAESIRGRNIIILPDADLAGREGAIRNKKLLEQIICRVEILDLFPGLNDGSDLADLEIITPMQSSWECSKKDQEIDNQELSNNRADTFPEPLKNDIQIQDLWNIDELIQYFESAALPNVPIQLNQCTKIINVCQMVERDLNEVKMNNGNHYYQPAFDRLTLLKDLITKQN